MNCRYGRISDEDERDPDREYELARGKGMNRYYVFVVNVICYTYTYTHKEYSEAVETLNSVINAMPKDLLPVRGCILNDDMEVIMSRFESGE